MVISDPIPSFALPPLNEVILGVQYDTKEAFNIATYGLLWERFKLDFPTIEHHTPLDPQFEKIGGRKHLSDLARFRIEPIVSAPLPRAWFLSDNNEELVQIQPDRFIRNWRRIENNNNEYPRYEKHIRKEFIKDLNLLNSFYQENELGYIIPNQCEISYINHINVSNSHKNLSEIFTGWSDHYDISDIADFEDINLTIKHIIKSKSGEFVGRLYIKVIPAFKIMDDSPIFVVELTVRGHPLGKDLEGVIKFMDLGRESIVRAFTRITTPKMHNIWKRER